MTTTSGIAIDIDDTIAETAFSCMEIISQKYPVSRIPTVKDILNTYHQPGFVPEWQTHEIQEEIRLLLNSTEFLRNIPAVEESRAGLRTLGSIIPITAYITSRTEQHRAVTQEWLDYHGFPKADVIMRFEETTAPNWKALYIEEHYPDLFGIVDNERDPYLEPYTNSYGTLFWFNRKKMKPVQSLNIVETKSWDEINSAVRRALQKDRVQ